MNLIDPFILVIVDVNSLINVTNWSPTAALIQDVDFICDYAEQSVMYYTPKFAFKYAGVNQLTNSLLLGSAPRINFIAIDIKVY